MKINLINTQDKLLVLIEDLLAASIISLDTEFVRRDTYYAKLSLIQIAFNSKIYLIDVLAVDIKPLWKSLLKTSAVKIIHSSRQDLEIFYHLFKELPNNIFDTQIAAKFCGYRLNISYAVLCKDICGVDLDKTLQASDWLARPLRQEMLEYAALDVTYLQQIYSHLKAIIDKRDDATEILQQINESLADWSIYKNLPEKAWTKIKFSDRSHSSIKKIKTLAAFREEVAMKLNIPRGFFITDGQLVEISKILPENIITLKKIQNLSKWLLDQKYSQRLFDICTALKGNNF